MAFWALDESITFLNHGAFGSCPLPVLEEQQRLRARLESEPLRFMLREREALCDQNRAALARFINVEPQDLVFVPNASTGVNSVLRSLRFSLGDELLMTDHAYNAAANALRFAAEQWGARVVVAKVPFPLAAPEQVIDAVLAAVTPRTRLAMLDHVTSATGLVFPLAALVEGLKARGVETLVDGAHAPGMIPLDVSAIGAAYYTGNLHKWVSAPKGAAFLHVRRALQSQIRPLVISHGANSPRTDKSRFQLEFDWPGTMDPTPWLCVSKALDIMSTLEPGGWPALQAKNRALALQARAVLCRTKTAPDEMIGTLVTVPLPDGDAPSLQDQLFFEHRIEAPVFAWPAAPRRLIRVTAHRYNTLEQYERLAKVLPK